MNITEKTNQIPQPKPSWHAIPQMRFQSAYIWLIFLSSLDIMFTWVILLIDGQELNPLAAAIFNHYALTGMIMYKFALITFVIIMCEIIGRKKKRTANMLITFGILITCVPIIIQFHILGTFVYSYILHPTTHTLHTLTHLN